MNENQIFTSLERAYGVVVRGGRTAWARTVNGLRRLPRRLVRR